MNYSQMSADLGMYNNVMPPPPPYRGHVPNQYCQQPIVQHQQHSNTMIQQNQQPLMQTQHSQQQYSIDAYNAFHGPPLSTKQNVMHTQAHDKGYLSQPQANQIQVQSSSMEWINTQQFVSSIPALSPVNSPTVQCHQAPPHQSMTIPQRRTSNPSPMHGGTQHPSYSPSLSPMNRPTPQNSQTSPGPQQFCQMTPASDARALNHVRRLSASNEFAAHQSLNTASPGQSHTVQYASNKMPSQVLSLLTHPAPHAPQPPQGLFSNQQHVPASQADSPTLLQPCSRPSPHTTTGLNVNHLTVRQASSSHTQLPHSNVYQSNPKFSNMNQMNLVGDRLDPRQGGRELFSLSKVPERQKEKYPDNSSNVFSASCSTRLPINSESQGAKTGAANNVNNFNKIPPKQSHLVVGDRSNRISSDEQSYGLFHQQELMSRFSAPPSVSQSWGGFKSDGPPQDKNTVSRGARGNRRARARGRGGMRGRGRARGRGTSSPQDTPVPLQPMQWLGPPTTSVHSFQSDIEAMQADVVADMVSLIQSKHPEGAIKAAQANGAPPKSNLYTSSVGETVQTSVSASHNSSLTTAINPNPVVSGSRAAALEAIRIKQEAVESIAKNKPEQSQSQRSDQNSKEEAPRPLKANNDQMASSTQSCQGVSAGHSESGRQQASLASNESPQPQPSTQSFQSSNLRKEEGMSKPSPCFVSGDKGNHDSLAFLLDSSSSVEKKMSENATSVVVSSALDQGKMGRQNSMPSGKPASTNIVKGVEIQRSFSVTSGSKLNPKGHLLTAGRHSSPLLVASSAKHQNMALENKRPMTAKERVISMWRDGQVVGRNPTLLKRPAKTNNVSQQPQQSEGPLGKPQHKPFSSDNVTSLQNEKEKDVPNIKKSRQAPREELSSKPKLDLYYIMFHGHKLICLKYVRDKMLLLCQFQFECFPDKGMGSVNNCIDRSLRIKKKPLQHQSQAEIISYLKKNEYKIDTEVLTINLEDAKRIYHHMYSIRNCVSASCVVELFNQPVDLSEDIPGSRKRTFHREILGRIKTESDPTDKNCISNQQNLQDSVARTQSAGQDENPTNNGSKKAGVVGDEDARSDCTVAYGADRASDDGDDDDLVILRVDENPHLIRYNGEGPKVGMLCNSLMGSVRSYVHNNEHYLVIEDLCKIFGSSDFNSLLDNQNIVVYSCCPEIGAFLNQISDKFSAVSSFHGCLVKEKDIGVQWANDQSAPENSTDVLPNRSCLKQEIVDEQGSCRAPKQPKLSAESASSPKRVISSESDLDSSEPRLQIDMDDSPKSSEGNFPARSSTPILSVNQVSSGKGKTVNPALIPEQASSEPPASSSPQSHSSADTLASTFVLDVIASNSNEVMMLKNNVFL